MVKEFNKDYFNKEYFFNRKRSNFVNYYNFDKDLYWLPVIRIVKKYKMTGNFLDLGCAFGFLAKRIVPYFKNIYGADISKYAIDKAKESIDAVKFINTDLNKDSLSFKDGFFNCIAALDVLEHTKSSGKSIKIIHEKLAKDGYLIVGFPVRDTLMGKIVGLFDKDPTHISIVPRKELLSLLKDNNFKILEYHYFIKFLSFHLKGFSGNILIVAQKT